MSKSLFNLGSIRADSCASQQLSYSVSMLTEPVLIPVDVLAVSQRLGSVAHDPAAGASEQAAAATK